MWDVLPVRIDERVRANAGRAAAVWLGFTQVLLAGVVFHRLLILGQTDSQIRGIQAVLASYLVLFGVVDGGCIVAFGVPGLDEWRNTWLPAITGPAIVHVMGLGRFELPTSRLARARLPVRPVSARQLRRQR